MTSQLHYYRCFGCCEVAVTEEKFDRHFGSPAGVYVQGADWVNAECGVCNSPVMYMGRVRQDSTKLEKEVKRSACDGRCTTAQGPECHCTCGCANHGTGRMVTVWRAAGKAPVLVPSSELAVKAQMRSLTFKAALNQAKELAKTLGGSSYAIYKAERSTNHANRMKLLTEYLTKNGATLEPVATVEEWDWRPNELMPEDHYLLMLA